jgi:HEAT repeat protein
LLVRARPINPEAVVRDLSSRDMRVRIEAAQHAHAVVGDDTGELRAQIIAALIAALGDEHPMVRTAVATALADLKATEAVDALLLASDDEQHIVRQLAITALGEIGDERATERIRRALRDRAPEVRFQAIAAFPRVSRGKLQEIWGALSLGLEDEDAFVRSRAAEACAELADGAELPATVADRLARVVRDSDEPNDARVAAAIALGESGDARAAPILLAVLRGEIKDADARSVHTIFELCGELGLEEARPLALAAAFSFRARFGDPGKRAAAIIALIRLGERRAIDHVLSELDARGWERRVTAVGIVARTRLLEAKPRIEALRNDPMLREIAADTLSRLES